MKLTKTQNTIIKLLFVNKISSRAILAKHLSLTNAGLTLALKPLLNEKMILEEKEEDNFRSGRKELLLSLNKDYGSFLSVDVRKHHLYFSEMDFAGNLIKESNNKFTTLESFLETKNKLIGVGVTLRGDVKRAQNSPQILDLKQTLLSLDIPYYIFNNVNCLAKIYYLFHHENKNFLLVKFGPGVGSSIYVNGKALGENSELGHTLYKDVTIEETISYGTLLNKEIEEKEGTKLLLEDPIKLNKIATTLSFALYNADSLLSLQKIILSGSLLTSIIMQNKLKESLLSLNKNFNVDKLNIYDDYESLNEMKGALGAFNEIFSN